MNVDEFMFAPQRGIVRKVDPKSWEATIETHDGALIERAIVLGSRLPDLNEGEFSDRPQYAVVWFCDAKVGRPVCLPVSSRLVGSRVNRENFVWYDEVKHYRMSIDTDGNYEVRTDNGELYFRIEENDGIVRLRTPRTTIVMKDADGSILIECEEKLKVVCRDAEVNVGRDASVSVGNSAKVKVGGDAQVSVEGNADMTIGKNATMKVGGNTSVTSSGSMNVQANSISMSAAAAVNITAGGAVTITGTIVTIN